MIHDPHFQTRTHDPPFSNQIDTSIYMYVYLKESVNETSLWETRNRSGGIDINELFIIIWLICFIRLY